jgi:replicative DNA helicase
MSGDDDTIEGREAHQGARGLDGFAVPLGPVMLGKGGTSDAVVDGPTPPGPNAEEGRARARRDTLAQNTWAVRGEELSAAVLARIDGTDAPVSTPWPAVNTRLGGGLWPGMHVIVGGTGTGKSQWALQVCMEAAAAGVPVLVLSLELDSLGVFARGASFLTGTMAHEDGSALPQVKWSAFYTGGRSTTEAKTDRDRARVREALPYVLPAMKALPFHWFEAPPHGLAHTEIHELAKDLRALHPGHDGKPIIMVVDFLQLVAGTDPREDTITRVSRAAYACRAVARGLGAVVLVLSSTSRESGKAARIGARESPNEAPGRPPAYDLVGLGKESGDVEFSADSVMVLCPETWPEGTAPLKGGRPVHLAVAKLRAGEPGWCEMRFNGSRFVEAPPAPDAEHAWCEECSASVRTQPHSSKSGALLCTRGGHTIEVSDGGPDAVPVVPMKLEPRKPRRGKGSKDANGSTRYDLERGPDVPATSDETDTPANEDTRHY